MNDRPDALELIRIANQTLTDVVLPDAKQEHLYPLRMIANALGIAARELQAHHADREQESHGLDALYNVSAFTEELTARNRKLTLDIRQGTFEKNPAREATLRQHLLTTARAKLAAANPKALNAQKDVK